MYLMVLLAMIFLLLTHLTITAEVMAVMVLAAEAAVFLVSFLVLSLEAAGEMVSAVSAAEWLGLAISVILLTMIIILI